MLMKELLGLGVNLLLVAPMAFVIFSLDQMVVGKVMGIVTLGVRFVARKSGRSLSEQISATVSRILSERSFAIMVVAAIAGSSPMVGLHDSTLLTIILR